MRAFLRKNKFSIKAESSFVEVGVSFTLSLLYEQGILHKFVSQTQEANFLILFASFDALGLQSSTIGRMFCPNWQLAFVVFLRGTTTNCLIRSLNRLTFQLPAGAQPSEL